MTSSICPDVNAALALLSGDHVHHRIVRAWYDQQEEVVLILCRMTQLGLLRRLTTVAVMGPDRVHTNEVAWLTYEGFFAGGAAEFWPELEDFEAGFRNGSAVPHASPKMWADAYLSAFAQSHRIRLLTLDAALAERTPRSILLAV